MSTEVKLQFQPSRKEGRSAAITESDMAATKVPTFVVMELSRRSVAAGILQNILRTLVAQ
jgi:hypothetical protein